ncbi:Transposase DDE domain-containing protein [Allgaiera indica]|uniref:Transposase DDE domain-containing protein n=1 Tax=Allgaiera indica TaxID=765699 RepID=A0A1H2ZHN7_9RHOB|nr:Transposase DDE domain-containing protein [Allgaiera indica]
MVWFDPEAAWRSGAPLNLLIDSTGVTFRGDGEWQVRNHGPSRRRQWRKVHIVVDTKTENVRAVEFTSSRQGGGQPSASRAFGALP